VLTAELKPSCGDGVVDPWEQCDDGNTADGDGCSASCTAEYQIYCAAAPPLVLGTNAGDNTGGQNLLAAACTGEEGKEALYSFTAPGDGILVLDLDAQAYLGVYVLAACPAGPLLGCSDSAPGGQHETLSFHMSAGDACTIVVDGSGPGETGPFDLTAYFLP
jgi:cysteine-rich repeat protein